MMQDMVCLSEVGELCMTVPKSEGLTGGMLPAMTEQLPH